MTTKLWTSIAAAMLAACTAGAAQAQILAQPGETMGVALGKPIPEGVYFVDLEDYGQRDHQSNRLGVNIPIVAWSTPFSFYDTRLEVLYAAPFTHIDGSGPGAINRVDIYSQGLLFMAAHDFGDTGFFAGLLLGPRTPDNFTQYNRGALLDSRLSIGYVGPATFLGLNALGAGPIKAVATFHYQGNFGGSGGENLLLGYRGFRDNIFVDFTLTKTVGKFEFGFVGSAYEDVGGPNLPAADGLAGTPPPGKGVLVGGLVGYAFPKVTVQAMVTREVALRNGGYGLGLGVPGAGKETRGWLRVLIPLYVAPTAPVVARY